MKKIATLLLAIFISAAVTKAAEYIPKRESRAVWLTTIGGLDWPRTYAVSHRSVEKQKKELTDILDKLSESGINTVLFQVRTRSSVLYPSMYEPWAACLAGDVGKDPGYDPLEFAISECHKRGMELHAWLTTIPVGKWNSEVCRRMRRHHSSIVRRNGIEAFLDPSAPGTGKYLASLCSEVTRNYDVDGIHLDYIRYPENYRIRISAASARENITDIVREIHREVKSVKPWVKLSCSPVGKYSDLPRQSSRGWNSRDRVFQDAQAWLRDGLMDMLFPMMYFKGDNFYPFLINWNENSYDGHVAAGLGIYMMAPREGNWDFSEIKRQMYSSRRHGSGFAFFRSKFFTDNTKGIYDFTKYVFDKYPALVPATKADDVRMPQAPHSISVAYTDSHYIVSWDRGSTFDHSPYVTYNVYASDKYPVDTDDARNLIRCRTTKNKIAVEKCSRHIYFAVRTSDRYSRESDACQQKIYNKNDYPDIIFSENNFIKISSDALDAEYILVETMQGCIAETLPYKVSGMSVKDVQPGIYILRSLNKRGIAHRVGLMIKNE